ncbi:retrovirus-related pol polyprotein from transposon TNT 1-94 [Tanacetum coccineum]
MDMRYTIEVDTPYSTVEQNSLTINTTSSGSVPVRIVGFVGLEVGWIRRIQELDTAYWGFLGARIRRIFLDRYGVLVFRIVIFKISSFKLQNTLFDVINEVDERSSEEYLRDLEVEYHERAHLANSKRFIKRRNNLSGQKANENTECYKCGKKGHFARDCFSKTSNPSYQSPVNNYSSVSKGFQPKFTSGFIQSAPYSSSQADLKFQKDYKAEYKKMKAKLALLKASPSSSQNPKTFQTKNKGFVGSHFNRSNSLSLFKV